jgi:hypothetical protein
MLSCPQGLQLTLIVLSRFKILLRLMGWVCNGVALFCTTSLASIYILRLPFVFVRLFNLHKLISLTVITHQIL